MTKHIKRSVFYSGPSGWKEIDPDHGLVKVEMNDLRVIEAQRLQVKFLLGEDLAAYTNTALEAEVERLTNELDAKHDALVASQVACTNLEGIKVAIERTLAARITELASTNADVTRLTAELATERSKPVDTTEADRLRKELDSVKSELNAKKSKPEISLPADTQRIGDLQKDNDAKANRIRQLEIQLAARPAVTAAPQPAVAPAAVVTSAPGWFARLPPVKTVRGNPLTAIAVALLVLIGLSMWYGARHFAPTPSQQALLAQSDLQTCNNNLAYAKEVQKTTEGARDAANDLAMTALAELDKTRQTLVEKVATAPLIKEPPADKPKDQSKLVLEVPQKSYAVASLVSPQRGLSAENATASPREDLQKKGIVPQEATPQTVPMLAQAPSAGCLPNNVYVASYGRCLPRHK